MDKHLLKILESANFTSKEAMVYLALLEIGDSVISQISQKTQLKRPIVYVIIESLIARGYAHKIPDKKVNTYLAANPEIILNQLLINAKSFKEMLPLLYSIQKKGKSVSKIRYCETKEEVLSIFNQMSRAKEAFFLSSYVNLDKIFPGIFSVWDKESKLVKRKQSAKYIIPNTKKEIQEVKKVLKDVSMVRALNGIEELNIDFTLFDNKLGLCSLGKDVFGVVFESENIVNSMKLIFELLWENGKKI